MSGDIFFSSQSKDRVFEAIEYYEDCSPGLGLEFSEEILSTIQRIIYFPNAWGKFSKDTRRCLTKRFPSGIIYQVSENKNEVLIIAVMQLNRTPNYWKDRIK